MPRTPSRPVELWLDGGLLDVEFYSALRGRTFGGAREAVEDFVDHGMGERLSPHPFLDFVSLPAETRRAWRQGRVRMVLAQLAGDDGRVSPVGPLCAPADPARAREHLLDVATRLGREARGDAVPEPAPVDWRAVAGQSRQPGRTSVVVVATEARRTVRAVESLLQFSGGHEIEVLVMDVASPPHVSLALNAAFHKRAGVDLVRLPPHISPAMATNLGVARTTGEFVVLLAPHVHVRRHWLDDVLDVLADPAVAGVQPLLLRTDETIDSGGLAVLVAGGSPTPLLAGHPKEDARRLGSEPLVAVSGDAMVLRAADFAAADGLDPGASRGEATIDLCARLLRRHPGGFRVAPTALATSRAPEPLPLPPHPLLQPDPGVYHRIGFTTEEREARTAGSAAGVVVSGRLRSAPDQLRWSLELPSPPGRGGDNWGDTYFADALAAALRDLGQDVVSRRRGTHGTGPTHLDDVSLALRGLYPIPPTPGNRNVLWVISHPDDVDPAEFDGYDLVCAASVTWSAELSARTGREVVPLLQATEFGPPAEGPSVAPSEPGVVFVGSTRNGRRRPLVWQAVEAGVPLAVYGSGWEDLPAGLWLGEHVNNRDLPGLYHRHGIVLADHWPDMARNGFIANRVFDALASGARVISDDVAGVHDVFDPRDVVVARTAEEVARAVAELRRPPDPEVARPDLSFRDRARTLMDLLARG